MTTSRAVGSAVVIGLVVGGRASAQCQPQWLPQPTGSTLDGPVEALAVWNGDLIAAGGFASAGGQPAAGTARWDGGAWHPLGSGLGSGGASSLIAYADELIAGGAFTSAGSQPIAYLARWGGAAWAGVGGGLDGEVRALAVYEDALVVTGAFATVGGTPAPGFARWSGSEWTPITGGPSGETVATLAVHEGILVAGGYFFPAAANMARWDGTKWTWFGPSVGPLSDVHQIAAWRDDLIVTGFIGDPFPYPAWLCNTAQSFPMGPPSYANWMAAAVYRDEPIVGGFEPPPMAAPNIHRWSGGTWVALGSGVNHFVHALTVFEGELIAGGWFTTAGGLPSPYWARWGCPCYADCDNAGGLTIADFGCFQTQFVKGDFYADCNSDNALTIADFGCFQTKFVAGCP